MERRRDEKNKKEFSLSSNARPLTPASKLKPKRETGDCMHWMSKGHCEKHKEGKCPYNHKPDKKGPGSKSPSRGRPKEKGKGRGKGKKGEKGEARGERSPSGQSDRSNGSDQTIAKELARAALRATSPSGKEDRPPCRYFFKGSCTKGKQCDYAHRNYCNLYQKGECKNGHKCNYLHVKKPKPVVSPSPSPRSDEAKEAKREGRWAKRKASRE